MHLWSALYASLGKPHGISPDAAGFIKRGCSAGHAKLGGIAVVSSDTYVKRALR